MELIRDQIEQRDRERRPPVSQAGAPAPVTAVRHPVTAGCRTAPARKDSPMHHALIVARMAPGSAPDIAELFAASDSGGTARTSSGSAAAASSSSATCTCT